MKNEKFGAELAGSIELKKLDKFLSTKKNILLFLDASLIFLGAESERWWVEQSRVNHNIIKHIIREQKKPRIINFINSSAGKRGKAAEKNKRVNS